MSRVLAFSAVALALVAGAAAFRVQVGAPQVEDTNVCNLDWYYCPRDPGCKTYTMSVKSVFVHDDSSSAPVKAEDLKPGDKLTLEVDGVTTITHVPTDGSYRIYALDGHNIAAGALSDVFTLNAPDFKIVASFEVTADNIGADNFFEFGLDVFQQGSGSDEGMCIEIADIEYLAYEKSKPDPPFEMMCRDNGDGTFTPVPGGIPIEGTPLPAPSCQGPACNLDWYLCPRDPGCITYTFSPESVEVFVYDESGLKAGDRVRLTVNGTTSIRTIPASGSYKLYALSGHNLAAGVLADALTLSDCGDKGCHFGFAVDVTVTPDCFNAAAGWFEFGLDVFQKKSGTDEGFCIEVANPTYVNYLQTSHQPPPGFVQLCKDEGWGHYINDTLPDIVTRADCVLV